MPESKVVQLISSKVRNFARHSHGTLMNSQVSIKGGKMIQKKISVLFISLILFSSLLLTVRADEGMFLLNKIDQSLMEKMKKMGLELSLDEIYNSKGTGVWNAVLNLGATASFVSPKGLIVTNHHVAFGAVQRISTAQKNYIETGFLARSMEEEAPAPGIEASILLSIEEVTKEIFSAVKTGMTDFERYMAVENKIKEIVKNAEKKGGVECEVRGMNYGMEYYLFSFMRLKDIRIVYVPARSIGEYGGEVDNWMWPRHTGDFAFLRAYVGPDGKPAEYSKNNVPYQPKTYLKISAKGIKEGDFAMIIGYPGRTYQRLTSFGIEEDIDFRYAFQIQSAKDLIKIFEYSSAKDRDAEVKLASIIKGLYNGLKNNQGMLEGLVKANLLEKKRDEEKAFFDFLKTNPELEKKYGAQLAQIEALYRELKKTRAKNAILGWIGRGSQMTSLAMMINKWSVEKEKKDMEREPGYQERDRARAEQRLKVAQRSLVPEADKKALEYFLKKALALPEGQKIKAAEDIVSSQPGVSQDQAVANFLEKLYRETKLASAEDRVKMFELSRKDLLNLGDPFIQLASELEKEREVLNLKSREFSGALSRLMPVYLEGVEAWKKTKLYPDANGTLRFNYGKVKGYSPRDAVWYRYLTSLTGVVEKQTGKEPFNNPERLLDVYKTKDFGAYVDKNINDVPVNFLTDNHCTGGNSGSPVLNGKGELIGLLFDGNYEAMYSDYYFDPDLTRSINVDIRYVLFIAERVDKALNVLEELTIVR
jgi:hypothetical protein